MDTRAKPARAGELTASEEASQLEDYLQKQLEDDVARIFDESIYSDLEVACGKLKLLTHSCILKARTNKFYTKLQTFLHANIGRNIFDEIYSFISDAYTECNIKQQEKEILEYLKDNLSFETKDSNKEKVPSSDEDVFLTPKCLSPFAERVVKESLKSPSTELTRDYYTLVPIDGHLLEQELSEQDALSNAFQSIINTQAVEASKLNLLPPNKPTTLSLTSSHTSKTIKHSSSCDNLRSNHFEDTSSPNKIVKDKTISGFATQKSRVFQTTELIKNTNNCIKTTSEGDILVDKLGESTYTPDSLITDEPSSSSDYLSATYTCPSGTNSSICLQQINVGDTYTKMDNIFTPGDSGLDNGFFESQNSLLDTTTLTDLSLTESTLQDLKLDDINQTLICVTNPTEDNLLLKYKYTSAHSDKASLSSTSTDTSNGQNIYQSTKVKDTMASQATNVDKRQQHEENINLESSSVSSETGSWESVFPPKLNEKEMCEKFISHERHLSNLHDDFTKKCSEFDYAADISQRSDNQSHYKSTSCFIDAAGLMDDEEIHVQDLQKIFIQHEQSGLNKSLSLPVVTEQELPCAALDKLDLSPNDCSESNELEDSLDQQSTATSNSNQKNSSENILEIILPEEGYGPVFHSSHPLGEDKKECDMSLDKNDSKIITFSSKTPHNSIMSLEESTKTSTIDNVSSNCVKINNIENNAASVENNLLKFHEPLIDTVKKKPPKKVSAWVVDMLDSVKNEHSSLCAANLSKKPFNQSYETIEHEKKRSSRSESRNKNRNLVDSDSNEKSSHKFYIDLSSLPDPIAPDTKDTEKASEKQNMFSMYIDLGEKSKLKEMPPKLSSALSSKKHAIKNNACNAQAVKQNIPQNSGSSFEVYESLCNDPRVPISEIISLQKERSECKRKKIVSLKSVHEQGFEGGENHQKIETTIQEQPSDDEQQPSDSFVKLSDLDKPPVKYEDNLTLEKASERMDDRMTRSIPENNCGLNRASTSQSTEIISSFHSENALSLNRLFPQLKNEVSKSMPGLISGRTRTFLFTEPVLETEASNKSEVEHTSDTDSMQNSSTDNKTTEEVNQTHSVVTNCQSRLGRDLMLMFLEEIASDVIVEVSGKRIKAHKCILSSRCQYFAAILSGGFVESAGNVIVLPPFSFNVVLFALCHIYSGESVIPESINIVELATISDMLGLEGLKEAIMLMLKIKYCHNFHRPCVVCIAGVLECFPLAAAYGLDDLYRNCITWIKKYFYVVWPTKSFATLPIELLDICYKEQAIQISSTTFINTVYGCGVIMAALQNITWSENVQHLCKRLMNAAALYASGHLVDIFQKILPLIADAPRLAKRGLEECVTIAIGWAHSDEICRAYGLLSRLIKELHLNQCSKPDLTSNDSQPSPVMRQDTFLHTYGSFWLSQCERALLRVLPIVMKTQTYRDFPSDVRKRLQELGGIFDPEYYSSGSQFFKRSCQRQDRDNYLNLQHVRSQLVPYSELPSSLKSPVKHAIDTNTLTKPKKKSTRTNPPIVRMTNAQEKRAKFNLAKRDQSRENGFSKSSRSRTHSFPSTIPSYVKPKTGKGNEKKTNDKKLPHKIMSSSDSSANSSPVHMRHSRLCRKPIQSYATKANTMSHDSLATISRPQTAEPSTASLSESQISVTNKYATYTKTVSKKGSAESVNNITHAIHNGSGKIKQLASATGSKEPTRKNHQNRSSLYDMPSSSTAPVPFQRDISSKIPSHLKPQSEKVSTAFGTSSKLKEERKLSGSHKEYVRKASGSLMNATKASQAKMVLKVTKPQVRQGCDIEAKKHVNVKQLSQQPEPVREDIPVKEHSGTLNKDKPKFHTNKTSDTNDSD